MQSLVAISPFDIQPWEKEWGAFRPLPPSGRRLMMVILNVSVLQTEIYWHSDGDALQGIPSIICKTGMYREMSFQRCTGATTVIFLLCFNVFAKIDEFSAKIIVGCRDLVHESGQESESAKF